MADVGIKSYQVQHNDGSIHHVGWEALTSADSSGVSLTIPRFSDKTVSMQGAFNGATVSIQGSNDPLSVPDSSATWFDLTDPQGNPIVKSAGAMEQITENPLRIRPTTSGGGGSQSINVYILAKLNNPLRT